MMYYVRWNKERDAAWIYEGVPEGEPAFELKLRSENETTILEVTPMHMDGSPAETVTVVAR